MDLKQLVIDGVTYDLMKAVFMAAITAIGATFIAKAILKILESWREILYFFGTVFVVIFVGVYMFGPQTLKPKLAGGIQNVTSGGLNNDKDTIAILTLTVMNAGSMQSIIKQWDVEATISGLKYKGGMIVPAPKLFTFKSKETDDPHSPTAVTYHGEDAILDKAMVPIQPGGMVTGTIYILFPKLDPSLFRAGAEYVVSYEDVLSTKYSAKITSSAQVASLSVTPGLHSDLVCPLPSTVKKESVQPSGPLSAPPALSIPLPDTAPP